MDRRFHFNLVAFILAFCVGMVYVYLKTPPLKVVVKYPTPFNAGKTVYKDSADTCFVFNASRVQCTKNAKKQPVVDEN